MFSIAIERGNSQFIKMTLEVYSSLVTMKHERENHPIEDPLESNKHSSKSGDLHNPFLDDKQRKVWIRGV